ncbi:hypothetical protein CNYM01_14134 [Colletotrichum nymphaeae SA-01]|uniref:Uncharacterized protein n=1 Tax=Colletotrichum nymphaeae SA-01 TaxID=1460502 RepID=A0A135UP42_9PEZI|nr:hypothetical protein CNYM01_14134 [Colletotrichum nymphaeae SA-01]
MPMLTSYIVSHERFSAQPGFATAATGSALSESRQWPFLRCFFDYNRTIETVLRLMRCCIASTHGECGAPSRHHLVSHSAVKAQIRLFAHGVDDKAARLLKRPRRSSGLSRLPIDIDNAVAALGGRTHANDLANSTIQSQKAPVSMEKRLEELVRDSGRLRQELDYWKSLAFTGTTFMSDVEQATVQLRDIVSRLEGVMNETQGVNAEDSESLGADFSSEYGASEDVERQARDGSDLAVAEDDSGVLLAPVRRGREGYNFEAVKAELKRKQPPYNPGSRL